MHTKLQYTYRTRIDRKGENVTEYNEFIIWIASFVRPLSAADNETFSDAFDLTADAGQADDSAGGILRVR